MLWVRQSQLRAVCPFTIKHDALFLNWPPFFIQTSYADSALNDYDSDFLNFLSHSKYNTLCLIHTWLDLEFRHTFDFLKSHSNWPERLAYFVSLERKGQWHVSMAFLVKGGGADTTGRTIRSLLSAWPSYSYNVIFKMLPNRKILLIILYCMFLCL